MTHYDIKVVMEKHEDDGTVTTVYGKEAQIGEADLDKWAALCETFSETWFK